MLTKYKMEVYCRRYGLPCNSGLNRQDYFSSDEEAYRLYTAVQQQLLLHYDEVDMTVLKEINSTMEIVPKPYALVKEEQEHAQEVQGRLYGYYIAQVS